MVRVRSTIPMSSRPICTYIGRGAVSTAYACLFRACSNPTRSFRSAMTVRTLVIEGDNLQVMVSLRSQFNASVDVVYLDPPYNRGGNDFRYSDARFHDPDADGSDAVYVSNE